jgi:hypothetical protein
MALFRHFAKAAQSERGRPARLSAAERAGRPRSGRAGGFDPPKCSRGSAVALFRQVAAEASVRKSAVAHRSARRDALISQHFHKLVRFVFCVL